jgi:hypothetical protein
MAGMPDSALNGGFAVSAGMLKYALHPDTHYPFHRQNTRETEHTRHSYMRKMGRWIAESF